MPVKINRVLELFLLCFPAAVLSGQTIVDYQPEKVVSNVEAAEGRLELTALHPGLSDWYLVRFTAKGGKTHEFHFEVPDRRRSTLELRDGNVNSVVIKTAKGNKLCRLWKDSPDELIRKTSGVESPFVQICENHLYLRKHVEGARSTKESMVEFLRDNVWGGEQITNVVKDVLYQDKFLSTGEAVQAEGGGLGNLAGPRPAAVTPEAAQMALKATDLGISLQEGNPEQLRPGQWYRTRFLEQAFVSIIRPELTALDLKDPAMKRLGSLDSVEKAALSYFIAFDLEGLDLGFVMGTEHPRVDWSERALPKVKDLKKKGPDGFDRFAPLMTSGMIRPDLARKVKATFVGGFKRSHGAFKWGPLSAKNHGSHYGYMENGVVFSSLQPDLATITVDGDGAIDMLTWTGANAGGVRFARQNGVSLVDFDHSANISRPGIFVSDWAQGNWSGSAEGKQRTVRGGICLQEEAGRRYLIYGYFSSVTPAAMARVFLSYGCKYAMHLDMNALEHTYLAIYRPGPQSIDVEHLIKGMSALDRQVKDVTVPRFLGYADNRDFFYLRDKERLTTADSAPSPENAPETGVEAAATGSSHPSNAPAGGQK